MGESPKDVPTNTKHGLNFDERFESIKLMNVYSKDDTPHPTNLNLSLPDWLFNAK